MCGWNVYGFTMYIAIAIVWFVYCICIPPARKNSYAMHLLIIIIAINYITFRMLFPMHMPDMIDACW